MSTTNGGNDDTNKNSRQERYHQLIAHLHERFVLLILRDQAVQISPRANHVLEDTGLPNVIWWKMERIAAQVAVKLHDTDFKEVRRFCALHKEACEQMRKGAPYHDVTHLYLWQGEPRRITIRYLDIRDAKDAVPCFTVSIVRVEFPTWAQYECEKARENDPPQTDSGLANFPSNGPDTHAKVLFIADFLEREDKRNEPEKDRKKKTGTD